MLSFATFAVGFLVRPIGGLVFGHVGDRIGRRRTLAATMLLMGVATALMGALPTAAQVGVLAPILLLVLRIIQGFALGGEWAGAVLLAVEHAPAGRKGRFGSIPQVGLALGLGLGTAVFALLQTALTSAEFLRYGWRIAFGVSIVLVVIGVLVQLAVDETPAFVAAARSLDVSRAPVLQLLADRTTRRNTGLGLLARWGEGSAFNTWGVFALTYATASLGLHKVPVLIAVTAAAAVMAVVIPLSGSLTDRFGAVRVYGVGVALSGLAVFPVFALFGTHSIAWFTVGLIVAFGLVYGLFYGAQGTLFAQLFPTEVRYTGVSLVYQFSGIYAAGLTPLILTALTHSAHGAPWPAAGYLVVTALISVLATVWIGKVSGASPDAVPSTTVPDAAAEGATGGTTPATADVVTVAAE